MGFLVVALLSFFGRFTGRKRKVFFWARLSSKRGRNAAGGGKRKNKKEHTTNLPSLVKIVKGERKENFFSRARFLDFGQKRGEENRNDLDMLAGGKIRVYQFGSSPGRKKSDPVSLG